MSATKKLSATTVVQNRFSIGNLLKWKFAVSKKLLIIRPKVNGDNYTSMFSFQAAELVKTKAVAEGWTVTDLQATDTNRANVESTISSINPDFIIHYDHGSDYALYGQTNNIITAILDAANVTLFEGKAASTVSCESATGLGPLAVDSNAKAYMGYDELHWVHLWYVSKFTEASNAANYALLEGKTYQEAYDIAMLKYEEKYAELLSLDSYAASLMLHNKDHLKILGNVSAKASGVILSKVTTATAVPAATIIRR
jgi:hypothetical protein